MPVYDDSEVSVPVGPGLVDQVPVDPYAHPVASTPAPWLPPVPFADGIPGATSPLDDFNAAYPAPPPHPDAQAFGPANEAAATPSPLAAPPSLAEQIDALGGPSLPDAPLELSPPPPYGADPSAMSQPVPPSVIGPQPPGLANFPGFALHTETHAEQYAGHPWDNPDDAERDAAAQQWAAESPEKLLAFRTHLAEAKAAAYAAEQHRVEQENLRQIQADIDARKQADDLTRAESQRILADAVTLANTKLDRKRWFRDKTVGEQVATIGVALIGGLLQGANGGRNTGMDWITSSIDKDIDDQKADIENKRGGIAARQGAVAQEFARNGNLYQAAEVVRAATYHAAIEDLKTFQQNFDPRGTSFADIAAGMQELAARQAAGAEIRRKTRLDENYKLIKADQDERKLQSDIAKAKSDAAVAWANIGIERDKASAARGDSTVLTPQEIHQQFPALPIAAIPPKGATLKQLGAYAETYNKTLDTAAKTLEGSPDERNIQRAVPGIVDDKGELVHFADKDIAAKVADAKESVDETVRLTDELIGMVKKNGWSSDLIKSKEWVTALQNYNEILIRKKETDKLGVLTGPDVSIVTKEIGTDNPTEVRGQKVVAALEHFRQNQIEGFNSKIRNKAVVPAGRAVARWEPPHLDLPDAAPSAEQDRLESLLNPPKGFPEEFAQELARRSLGLSPEEAKSFGAFITPAEIKTAGYFLGGRDLRRGGLIKEPSTNLPLTPTQKLIFDEVARDFDPQVSLEQRREIARLGDLVRLHGAESEAAAEALDAFTRKGKTSRFRSLAQGALDAARLNTAGEPELVR